MMPTEATFHGPTWIADTMVFNNDEPVDLVPVTQKELRPTLDDAFVHPDTDDWRRSEGLLVEPGVLVIRGEVGTGRGTSALRRLREQVSTQRLFRLEAGWEQPKARLLPPAMSGLGYLLDLTDYDKAPADDFGAELHSWAANAGARLLVLIHNSQVDEAWLSAIRDHIVHVATPDGKQLASSILRVSGVPHLVQRLDDTAFLEIWSANPRASDVLRLTELMRTAGPESTSEQIAEEFLGWRSWFKQKCPKDFGERTLVWSAALCDGGRSRSVLAMSEALRKRLGERRSLVDIFSDEFASERLENAKLDKKDDRVRLDPQSHGLADAVRLHLWNQFANYQETLLDWSIDCLQEIDEDDARRVIASLMNLATRRSDHKLVQKLFDKLSGQRPELLVEELSNAALDPVLGSYIRGRLYTWLAARPSQEKVDTVAAVCAGEFGLASPRLALTRLGRAADRSPNPTSPALAAAFTKLGNSEHRALVLRTIQRWLREPRSERAGIAAFLCLAGSEDGITVLQGDFGLPPHEVTAAFGKALSSQETHGIAVRTLLFWKDSAAHGLVDQSQVVEVYCSVLAQDGRHDLLKALAADQSEDGFAQAVFDHLTQRPDPRANVPHPADGRHALAETAQPDGATATTDADQPSHIPSEQGHVGADEA